MARSRRRPVKARSRVRTGSRQPVVVFVIAATLAFAAFAADKYAAAQRQAAAAATGPDDEEVYTGSILYMPNDGIICRQLLFDNHNGRFTDNGYVDCEQAAYRGSLDVPRQWSVARLQVISTGFFKR